MGESTKKDFWIIVLCVVGLWLLWYVNGGPQRDAQKYNDDTQTPSTQAPQGNSVILENKQSEAESPDTSLSQQIAQLSGRLSLLTTHLATIANASESSPWSGQVSMLELRGGIKETDPGREYIVLQAAPSVAERVDITGWKLESASLERPIVIPGAVALPEPSGVTRIAQPLFLGAGETVVMTSGSSPIGTSFRTNICTGYLDAAQSFVPSLARDCPQPVIAMSLTDTLMAAVAKTTKKKQSPCAAYLAAIPSCTAADTLPAANPDVPESCINAAENQNSYGSCVAAYRSKPNFLSNEWRVFLNQNSELWQNDHDAIVLLDAEDRIVDVFTY